ncbi:MAG: hypothetical protein UFA98_07310 [Ruminococcus sp.]|nr:hypothetical protein [Ruminococcus sp.]
MNKHSRLITALLALIFCVSAVTVFSTQAFAESQIPEGGETPVVDPEPVYTDPITPEPDPVYTDPVVPDPIYTDPVDVDPGDGGGGNSDSGNSGNSDSGNSGSSDNGNSGNSDSGNSGNSDSGNSGSSVYYDSDGNEHADQSDVYVGGGQSYDPPVSTAPSVGLVKTDNNIDVNELSKNDWDDIKASLEKASKGGKSDTDDFSFIQKNTAKEDNGHMLFVIGLAMVILSVAGFTYLIVSAVIRRKKIKAGAPSTSASHSAGSSHYRSNSDYNDGFKASSKKASKFDTADIPNVSKDQKAQKPKSKGGKRYK